jgi:hypothetical protein
VDGVLPGFGVLGVLLEVLVRKCSARASNPIKTTTMTADSIHCRLRFDL